MIRGFVPMESVATFIFGRSLAIVAWHIDVATDSIGTYHGHI